ncbi:TPA: phage head-binding domain-containing protein [Escherichia coli]|uniref:phage head-binding domain-containing protein n=1 Tax=Escherichia coli TaxID=562 RepID=UPI0021C1AE30|nr:phage head-binding domain-containing protein [Escherichia coli]MCT9832275.1 phage head-binding domain-containing protein [Escherichia coli]
MTDITANVVIGMPSQLFTMARSFKAVANGKIYIGKIDTDPVNPENQIQVYVENEDGSHVPVSQPIIINAAGYPVYNGQIAKFVTVQGHSMAVYDAYGSQQFYFPNVLKYDPDQLRQELAAPGGVDLVNGAAKQTDIDNLNKRSDVYAYIEDYANLVVDDDWSYAIQAAFDTGKEIIGIKGKKYKVTKIINTKGQRYVGELTLDLQRISIPNAVVTSNYAKPDNDFFRGIYVGTAYDFCEMLRIKSLGFNTVIHYCYFDNNGTVDMDGTMPKLLNNCLSAGLNVVINTNIESSHGQGTVAEIVGRCDSFSNCIGYSVVDEPASRGISVADQDQMIATLRELTSKKLFSVDYMWVNTPWEYKFSRNYDVFLVNSYSMYYSSGSLQERVDKDLGKMRTDIGGCMMVTGSARIIPVVQTFSQFETNPVEGINGSYCFDVDQIVSAARVFGKTGNGDFAAFCWDNGFTTTLAKEVKYQTLVKELVNHADKGEIYRTEPILFGGVGGYPGRVQYPLGCLNAIQTYKDPLNTIDNWLGGGAAPVRLMTGSSETPLRTTLPGVDTSGIGFNKTFSRLVTTKSLLKYFTGFAVFENYGNPLLKPASFEVYSTTDGGYTEALRYTTEVTAGSSFRFSGLMTNSYDGIGDCAVFALSVDPSDALDNYRRIIYGLFISTNW